MVVLYSCFSSQNKKKKGRGRVTVAANFPIGSDLPPVLTADTVLIAVLLSAG